VIPVNASLSKLITYGKGWVRRCIWEIITELWEIAMEKSDFGVELCIMMGEKQEWAQDVGELNDE
jgi:hypothetical protein